MVTNQEAHLSGLPSEGQVLMMQFVGRDCKEPLRVDPTVLSSCTGACRNSTEVTQHEPALAVCESTAWGERAHEQGRHLHLYHAKQAYRDLGLGSVCLSRGAGVEQPPEKLALSHKISIIISIISPRKKRREPCGEVGGVLI